ncbi:MAG TPA: cysteine--tRNA ligase [Bacteroidetes bacterium]|nr:MAG: cysteine--tRNA ligase [Bacteroidota bacterium]HHL57345.1 cysteine--tRNA ligase [Bacteroidota bacterium]
MENQLQIYNTLTRRKEIFEPIKPPHVGMYVCGPTVYGDAHLGHARAAITFDIVFRYLLHLGYKVRYVRNITDVGHLENDTDELGEDKIAKKARLEELEPMEVVQYFANRYHKDMERLNVLPPSIEPTASGHIIEQIAYVKEILEKGYGYEKDGSVYFDVVKYNKDYNYGKLSGRKVEDLLENTRELAGQEDKKNSFDFALWKKADPKHIMRWPSPWSEGYPGWHMECSAMSSKYLGDQFDIHGGGLDLLFPHHESEIAQSNAAKGHDAVKYWMHNNMITVDGQKMGKSLNNFITLNEFFSGEHKALDRPYAPMTIRFFMLQAHYRSTLDFSNDALKAAEKGMNKLFESYNLLDKLKVSGTSSTDVRKYEQLCFDALNDDFNTPIVLAHLFDLSKVINQVNSEKETLTKEDVDFVKNLMGTLLFNILGLRDDREKDDSQLVEYLMKTILDIRQQAKENKDYATADKIREELEKLNIRLKDSKEGTGWTFI